MTDPEIEPHYTFPTHQQFRQYWPELARDLIVADWRIEGALAGVDDEIDIELLDPSRAGSAGWVDLYAEELGRFPALRYALSAENPVAEVARRARVPPNEFAAFRMWASEASERDIGRALGKPPQTIHVLITRARYRVLEWLVRGASGTAALPTYIEGVLHASHQG